jgi:hypothetical protein
MNSRMEQSHADLFQIVCPGAHRCLTDVPSNMFALATSPSDLPKAARQVFTKPSRRPILRS